MISKEDGNLLLKLARDSIAASLKEKETPITEEIQKKFGEKSGAFVTLKIDGQLRGCIGFIEAIYPLYETITQAAVSAAFSDPRFPPLTDKELEKIKIEVSVLTKPELMKGKREDYPKSIEIGKHGLIVEANYSKGLLLPQVFTEHECTPEQALDLTCEKAELNPGCWKEDGCKVFTFSCEIFSE
jgi:AmmeMemoRadiSam system protein A